MIVSDSDSQIVVIIPAAIYFGTADVTVTTPNGTSATSAADQFTYTNAPFISAIEGSLGQNLPTGHAGGGDTVRILGDNLDAPRRSRSAESPHQSSAIVRRNSTSPVRRAHRHGRCQRDDLQWHD